MKKPSEIIDAIYPDLKKCLDDIISKFPNIRMTIDVGGFDTKGKEIPYLINLDIDSVEDAPEYNNRKTEATITETP